MGYHKPVPLEEQFETLAQCGISLLPGANLDETIRINGKELWENNPYESLVYSLGSPMVSRYNGEEKLYTNSLFHFGFECIEESGDYAYIAHRMSILAGDTLPMEKIRDKVIFIFKFVFHVSWLSFQMDGKKYKWFNVGFHDWLDSRFLTRLAKLQDKRNRRNGSTEQKRFAILSKKSYSDCVIGCFTPSQLSQIRERTRLKFEWLYNKK